MGVGARRRLRAAGIAALAALALLAPATKADFVVGPSMPFPVNVILPEGYDDQPERQWPVVYLLNTAWDTCAPERCGPILDLMRAQPVITVYETTPKALGDYVDWHNGDDAHQHEAEYQQLVRAIDGRYRTIRDRDFRAVAGISAGGYGAALLAAHRPDLFGTLASFSGVLDIAGRGPASQAVFEVTASDPTADRFAVWGAPGRDDWKWHADNPADLAVNLRHTKVWHSASPGTPCDAAGALALGPDAAFNAGIEAVVRDTNDAFDAALTAAGVAHTYRLAECGLHNYTHFTPQVADWLDQLRFEDRPDPAGFSFKTMAPLSGLYGWELAASRAAPEFLTVEQASAAGLTLTGSGQVLVITPPLFEPGSTVLVDGQPRPVTDEGSIGFWVDLGPGHEHPQYSAANTAESVVSPIRTVTVNFGTTG